MTSTDGPDHPPVPIRFKEVEPTDAWFADRQGLSGSAMAGKATYEYADTWIADRQRPQRLREHHSSFLFEEERRLPASERSEVLYFDLARFSEKWRLAASGLIDPIIRWTEQFSSSLKSFPDQILPAFVAVGGKTKPRDRSRLNASGIHHVDPSRPSLRRLEVGQSRREQVGSMLQSLFSTFTLPSVFPHSLRATASTPPSGSPSATAKRWDEYYTAPSHISGQDVDYLWGKLTGDPEPWERDS